MSEEIMRQNLFVVAQAYAHATGLSLTSVSKDIHGNGGFFAGFIAGKLSCGLNTYFRMADEFRKKWPKNVRWPETTPIPKLARVPYRPGSGPARKGPLPPRGEAGKFLGKKVPKRAKGR